MGYVLFIDLIKHGVVTPPDAKACDRNICYFVISDILLLYIFTSFYQLVYTPILWDQIDFGLNIHPAFMFVRPANALENVRPANANQIWNGKLTIST